MLSAHEPGTVPLEAAFHARQILTLDTGTPKMLGWTSGSRLNRAQPWVALGVTGKGMDTGHQDRRTHQNSPW